MQNIVNSPNCHWSPSLIILRNQTRPFISSIKCKEKVISVGKYALRKLPAILKNKWNTQPVQKFQPVWSWPLAFSAGASLSYQDSGLDHRDEVLSRYYRAVVPYALVLPQYRVSSQKYRAVAVVLTPSSAKCQNYDVKTTDGTLFLDQFF